MRKKLIAAVAAALLAAAGIYAFIAFSGSSAAHTAEIRLEGRLVRVIDLDNAQDETFVVSSEYGSNTVRVLNGGISVIEASCPDKICVDHGELKSELLPIICLPNKLEITLK